MRARAATWACIASLFSLALAPARGAALDWQGGVGYEFLSTEAGAQGAPAPRLQMQGLDLDLGARGFVLSPGLADWRGSAGYRWYDWTAGSVTTQRGEGFRYDLGLDLFRNPRSPIWITGGGSRSTLSFSTPDASDQTGTREVTSYRAGLAMRSTARPILDLSYTFTDAVERNPVAPDLRFKTQTVTAITRHTTSSYSVSGQYEGRWADGTIPADNYKDHNVRAEMQYELGGSSFTVTDYYYRRVPSSTTDTLFNWASETNQFISTLRMGAAPGTLHYVAFVSTAGSVRPVGGEPLQRARNGLRYTNDTPLGGEWRLRSDADVSMGEDHTGTGDTSATGESLGSQLWWRRTSADGGLTEVLAGPTIGLLQASGQASTTAYGASATGRVMRPLSTYVLNGEYVVSYASNLSATAGSTLSQSLRGTADGPLWTGRLAGNLSINAVRTSSPTFGDGASRSVVAVAGYGLQRVTLQLQATLREGTAPEAQVRSDGLFLPVSYSSRGADLSGSLTARLPAGLVLGARYRYATAGARDLPTRTTTEATGDLTWGYGPWYLTLEDKLTESSVRGGPSLRTNMIMVRASRRFAGRF